MNEGPGNDDPDEPSAWEPIDEEGNAGDGTDSEAPDRDAEGWAERLERKQQQIDERARELERREGEILERREELVEKREELDAREEQLSEVRTRLEEREEELREREANLDAREEEVETKREALEEYAASGRTFTKKPRVAGGVLLWVNAVFAAVLAVLTFLYAGPGGIVPAGLVGQGTATVLAAVLALVAVVEVVGGYFAYVGQRWAVAVSAAVLGIVVFFPVGVTAAVMITVGESQFD